MGSVTKVYDAFVSLATQNGTVHDRGTYFMFSAAVLIGLLSLYFVYNLLAMVVNGVRNIFRAGRWMFELVAGERPQHAMAVPVPVKVGSHA